jgi:hypothetical protein
LAGGVWELEGLGVWGVRESENLGVRELESGEESLSWESRARWDKLMGAVVGEWDAGAVGEVR